MQQYILETPTGTLKYSITRRSRVTKRLHMELDESGGLVVVAPGHWTQTFIRDTLSQNRARVERFVVRARQRKLQALKYVTGELHLYLGTAYPLVIKPGPYRKTLVTKQGHEICVEHTQRRAGEISKALQLWYQQQALTVFDQRLQVVRQKAAWAVDRPVPLKLRKMKRTWGNCSSGGVIKLNTHLIKAPLHIIDSVIAHELCHLVEMNHGRAFYALLQGLNPNWRQDRKTLRSDGNAYLQ